MKKSIYYIFVGLLISVTVTITTKAEIQGLWHKYSGIQIETEDPNDDHRYPGRIIGHWTERPEKIFYTNWPYRGTTYEMYFARKNKLGRAIYGIALFVKDIDPSITLSRFERGAQGFHYSIEQVINWANVVLQGNMKFNTNEEFILLYWLMEEDGISIDQGRWTSTGKIKHLLGIAPGRKRSLKLNLNHERYHVIWDEDTAFRQKYTTEWNQLSEDKRNDILEGLKGYDKSNIKQIIEEWAVRQNESGGIW